MLNPLAPIAGANAAIAAVTGWSAIAQLSESGVDAGTVVNGSASLTAVGALVYVAKAMIDGRMVARDPSMHAAELAELAERAIEQGMKANELTQQALAREAVLQRMLTTATRKLLEAGESDG